MYKNPVVKKLVVVCDATTYVKNSHQKGVKKHGPAACGVVFFNGEKNPDKMIGRCGTYLGKTNNNRAESNAILHGLRNASDYCMWEIEVWSDNDLAIKQLNGVYRIHNEQLGRIIDEIKVAAHRYKSVSYHHHSEKEPTARLAHNEAKKYQNKSGS